MIDYRFTILHMILSRSAFSCQCVKNRHMIFSFHGYPHISPSAHTSLIRGLSQLLCTCHEQPTVMRLFPQLADEIVRVGAVIILQVYHSFLLQQSDQLCLVPPGMHSMRIERFCPVGFLSIHIPRTLIEKYDLSATRSELLQDLKRALPDGIHRRNDHRRIFHFANPQPAGVTEIRSIRSIRINPPLAGVTKIGSIQTGSHLTPNRHLLLRQQCFVQKVKINTCVQQPAYEFLKLLLLLLQKYRGLFLCAIMKHRSLYGMQHSDIYHCPSSRKHRIEPCKMVLHILVFLVPWGLILIRCRIIPLGSARHGHHGKMRHSQCHTKRCLPVSLHLHTFKIEIPSGNTIQLRQHALLTVLMHDGLHLLCR